jgi:hypothetical protein
VIQKEMLFSNERAMFSSKRRLNKKGEIRLGHLKVVFSRTIEPKKFFTSELPNIISNVKDT